jgi:hypothetical protein
MKLLVNDNAHARVSVLAEQALGFNDRHYSMPWNLTPAHRQQWATSMMMFRALALFQGFSHDELNKAAIGIPNVIDNKLSYRPAPTISRAIRNLIEAYPHAKHHFRELSLSDRRY